MAAKLGLLRVRFGMRSVAVGILMLLMGAGLFVGQMNAQATDTASPTNQNASSQGAFSLNDVLIAPGDSLNVVVFDTPEMTGLFRVGTNGTVYLPLINEVQIGGLTPTDAAKLIRRRLIEQDFMTNPQVTVLIPDLANHTVTMVGEVSKPGQVLLQGVHRLQEFVAASGGVTIYAGERVVVVRHGDVQHPDIYQIAWDKDLSTQPIPFLW